MVFREALGELVVLLGERPDVDAAERVGLRERKRERESRARNGEKSKLVSKSAGKRHERNTRLKFQGAPFADGGKPADTDDLFELFRVVDDHLLVVIVENNLEKGA